MNSFICLSLSPIELTHPGLAVATIRAGGVGVLDLEFCSKSVGDSEINNAVRNLDRLLELVNSGDAVGLRLPEEGIAQSQMLLSRLSGRPHWLILCRWKPQEIEEAIASLPPCPTRKLLLEVTDVDQALALSAELRGGYGGVHGLVAK